ncbi:MAG: hypothetical protein ABJQ70_16525 [Roseobacter sp.]
MAHDGLDAGWLRTESTLMPASSDIVIVLGSGPNAIDLKGRHRELFDRLVVINNAWQVRSDWDDLVFPEDFPRDRLPAGLNTGQRLIEANQFVPTQNAYGGFIYAGGTMAFTASYWALHALRPKILAFLGCDMVYPKTGNTHFYGTGAPDPLRQDVTLQDLGAKSARLSLLAATQGCRCVNLSRDESELLFERADIETLRSLSRQPPRVLAIDDILQQENALGYFVPTGRYWSEQHRCDGAELASLDAAWRRAWQGTSRAQKLA